MSNSSAPQGHGKAASRRRWAWLLVFAALGLVAFALPLAPQVPDAPVQRLMHATLRDIDGPSTPGAQIQLPLHWNVVAPGRSARVELRLSFDLPPEEQSAHGQSMRPWALLIPRVGQDWQVSLNGSVLSGRGEWASAREQEASNWRARRPVWIDLPRGELRARNELVIHLNATVGQRSGLAAPWVGPVELLLPTWAWQEALRVTLPQGATLLSLMVAALCGLIWLQERDALYAWAGGGELIWSMRLVDTWWEYAWLPASLANSFTLLLFWCWGAALFAMIDAVWNGARRRWERRLHGVVLVAGPLALALAWGVEAAWPVVGWTALSWTFWAGYLVVLCRDSWRKPSLARGLLCAALGLTLIAIARDVYAARIAQGLYEESAWNKYAGVGFALSILGVVGHRFSLARRALLDLNRVIAARLAERETELSQSFQQMARAERQTAVSEERNRILRDMHDGAGAHLIAAIHQVESGRGSTDELLQTLRGSLDQLRLSIDAVNLPDGDVMALLSSMRFRLARRLELAGIRLRWKVDELPLLPQLHAAHMRHLQFILLELISNAIQHARCANLRVSATVQRQYLLLELEDDGVGIRAAGGNGLRNVGERAALIGAVLQWPPVARGTQVRLRLPLGPGTRPSADPTTRPATGSP